MTQEQRRIKILEKRLRLLAEYLDRFNGSDNAPTFAQFIKSKGVTREMFVKDLPHGLPDVPANGMDNILEYALILQELLNGINNLAEMENASADGDDLRAGLIKYEGGQYIKDDCGCGGGCGDADDKNYSGSGGEQGGESVALEYILQDSGNRFDDYMSFAASGANKICIKPIHPILSEKLAPGMWRSYRNKITAYNKCVADKKAAGGYTVAEKAMRAANIATMATIVPRVSFLKAISLNLFGLAQTFERMRKSPNQSHWDNIKKKWYVLGGDLKKLDSNVSIGHSKKPVFKPKGWKPKGATTSNGADGSFNADGDVWYNADPYTGITIGAIITGATSIITAMVPVIKSFKKDNGEPDIDFEGIADPNAPGDIPDGSPDDDLGGEGLTTMQWVGISAGIAAVLGIVIFVAYKTSK